MMTALAALLFCACIVVSNSFAVIDIIARFFFCSQHLVHGKPRNDEGGGKRQYNHKAKFKEGNCLILSFQRKEAHMHEMLHPVIFVQNQNFSRPDSAFL